MFAANGNHEGKQIVFASKDLSGLQQTIQLAKKMGTELDGSHLLQ